MNKKWLIVLVGALILIFLLILFVFGSKKSETIDTKVVTFIDGFNNREISSQKIEVGKNAVLPDNPYHENYVFIGWYDEDNLDAKRTDFKNITENITVIAKYAYDINNNGVNDEEEQHFTVVFIDTFDDKVLSKSTILIGMDAFAPIVPAHEKRTFKGWSRSFTNIQEDIEVRTVYLVEQTTPTDKDNKPTVSLYDVTFIDGITNKTISTVKTGKGLNAKAPEPPKHDNKVFVRWDGNYNNVRSNLTITALYKDDLNNNEINDETEQRYTIEFLSGDNGTLNNKTKYENILTGLTFEQAKIIIPTPVANDGYCFDYWSPEINQTVTANKTYTAVFAKDENKNDIPDNKEAKLTVTFKNPDGSILKTEEVLKGLNATAPLEPKMTSSAQYNYIFKNWDKDYTNITENLTVTAVYEEELRSYTVTFKDWDDKILSTQTVKYGKSAKAPRNPRRESTAQYYYTFKGWDKDYKNITGDLTVTAVYKEKLRSYIVIFKDWDDKPLSLQTVKYGESAKAPKTPTRQSTAKYKYTFKNWDKEYNNITGNLIVTAIYERELRSYTVTFKDWNATTLSTQSVKYGENAKTPTSPTRESTAQYNYTFKGWDKNYKNITGDLTVTATYERELRSYTVTFKDWNATTLSTQTVKYGENAKAPAAPTRESTAQYHYTFKEWDKDYRNITGDLTVTATYKEELRSYTVTFKNWDDKTISTQTVKYGSGATAPTNPTRKNWEFKEWDKSFNNITGDLTVKAIFVKKLVAVEIKAAPNIQLKYQVNSNINIKDQLVVNKKYADSTEELALADEYSVNNFTTATTGTRNLNVTIQNIISNNLSYKITTEEVYSNKFEVIYNDTYTYVKCTSNRHSNQCDKQSNVSTDYKFLEIIEHCDEIVDIYSVVANYVNKPEASLYISDIVRWSNYSKNKYYNSVILTSRGKHGGSDVMSSNMIIDTVDIKVKIGYDNYKITFKYNEQTKLFTAISEVKI